MNYDRMMWSIALNSLGIPNLYVYSVPECCVCVRDTCLSLCECVHSRIIRIATGYGRVSELNSSLFRRSTEAMNKMKKGKIENQAV